MEKNKVLLGMSGGTDSSVAALLLQEEGYEVVGVTFLFYPSEAMDQHIFDARELCEKLGIEHFVYDATEQFQTKVVSYFVDEYMKGNTPVPCTLCNNYFKWPLLKQLADERSIYHIATGHYVQKEWIENHYHITCGADPDKDQSFFLWGLPQEILKRMLLPLGGYTKTRIREVAAERGYLKAAKKRDSLGVCFCPMDYRTFLRNYLPKEAIQPGDFYDEKGNILGKHEGYPFYTIGQRRGLGIHLNRAVFVKEIHPDENRVVLGDLNSLNKHSLILENWVLTNPDQVLNRSDVMIKVRYRKQENYGTVTLREDGLLQVTLDEPVPAIAVGQAAAFYRGNAVLGGGIILSSE
ncbi:MAG: tRNA 2-thiouridine(34) synthase MnmA [Phocaeicola sp.]